MYTVFIPIGVLPQQVDFPEFKLDGRGKPVKGDDGGNVPFGERSGKGALHIRPNSTLTVTGDELPLVLKACPSARVLNEPFPVVEESKKEPAAQAPKAEEPANDPSKPSAPLPVMPEDASKQSQPLNADSEKNKAAVEAAKQAREDAERAHGSRTADASKVDTLGRDAHTHAHGDESQKSPTAKEPAEALRFVPEAPKGKPSKS